MMSENMNINHKNDISMKRLFIALSLLLSVQLAGAQSKAVVDAISDVDKAKEALANPKKAVKPASWINLGEAYIKAFEAPAPAVVTGMPQPQIAMLLGGMAPVSSEDRIVGGIPYHVDIYPEFNLYYDGTGVLAIVEVTKAAYTDIDPLAEAINAFVKAGELETKEKGIEKVKAHLQNVSSLYFSDAMTMYSLEKYGAASDDFMKCVEISELPLLGNIDTLSVFNAAFTANLASDTLRAITMFERCVELGYYENGDVFASLAGLYIGKGDNAKGKSILEEGFKLFPSSQAIIIGLINYYLDNNEDPQTLFSLIAEAKANEPNNASLYYVEGNVYKGLGDIQKALECYYKSYEIDPNYVFGLYAAGTLWYDEAVRVSEIAQSEMDDKKYNALVEEFEGYMVNAIEPFETLFNATEDVEFKTIAAEYLKSINFRFRDRDQKYMDGYEKYNSYLNSQQNQ